VTSTETPAAATARRRPQPRSGRSYQKTTGVLLTSIARMMRTYFDRRARRLGLTRAQWLALNRLSLTRGIRSGDLAIWMEVEPITASRQIAHLESMGWAERRMCSEDRRQRLVHLTEAALPIVEQMNILGGATEQEMLSALTDDEQEQLRRMLIKVHEKLAGLVDDG
jgi:MarR family transcriptional regulator for hemolysin